MKRVALSLCALSLAGTAWHLAVNLTPPAFDDAWYLEISFRLYHSLSNGLSSFVSEYLSAFRTKAPLLAVLPLPIYFAAGVSESAAVWVNLPLMGLLLWSCARLGRNLHDQNAGWAAAAACSLTPLVYGMSRVFYVETLLTALVVLTMVLLTEAGTWGSRRAAALGVLLGLGLLAKVTFPAYVAGPLWLKRRELRPWLPRILIFLLPVAGTWYAVNAPYAFGFALSAGFGSLARSYTGPLSAYAQSLGHDALSWPFLAAAAVLLAADRRPPHRLLLAWAAPPALLLLLGVNREIRYWEPLLPALAVVLGAAAAKRPRLAALAALPALLVFSAQTFGRPSSTPLVFNGPPGTDTGWNRGGIVAASENAGAKVVAVCFEHPRLNANNLSSWAAMTGAKTRFVNLGHAQTSLEAALIRLKDKEVTHVLTVTPFPADLPPALNAVNEALAAARLGGARPVATIEAAPGFSGRLYQWKH
jgi:4-amino-4-deoxy-L-arabinose transferase-like glycosyltransferase